MSETPGKIEQLVETFERNLKVYRSGQYNETQVRREFIDPMFECLGWDMQNRAGYAEQYKDVIHEDALAHPTDDDDVEAMEERYAAQRRAGYLNPDNWHVSQEEF